MFDFLKPNIYESDYAYQRRLEALNLAMAYYSAEKQAPSSIVTEEGLIKTTNRFYTYLAGFN